MARGSAARSFLLRPQVSSCVAQLSPRIVLNEEEEFRAFAARMRGQRVTAARLFLFTLQLYLTSDAPDAPDLEVWCEPSWQLRSPQRVVTGSGAIDSPTDYGDEAEVQRASTTVVRVGDAVRVLVGRSLVELSVDRHTGALTLHFSDGLVVATFTDDPDSDLLWTARDPRSPGAFRGTPQGITRAATSHVV